MTHPTEPSRLLDVLRRAGEEFDRRRLPWALVGGLAVAIRAEPRFTRDVDLAVAVADDAAAEAMVGDLRAQGYRLETTLEQEALGRLATARLTPPGSNAVGIVLDLLFASSGLEQEVCEAAERLEILPGVSVPVARAGHLVAMKLLSRADHRLQDEIDLRNLAVVLKTEDIELARLAVARIEAVGANRGRELVADLARLSRGLRRAGRAEWSLDAGRIASARGWRILVTMLLAAIGVSSGQTAVPLRFAFTDIAARAGLTARTVYGGERVEPLPGRDHRLRRRRLRLRRRRVDRHLPGQRLDAGRLPGWARRRPATCIGTGATAPSRT